MNREPRPGGPSGGADFAPPLRWIGNGFRGLALAILAAMLWMAFSGRADLGVGDLLAPAIPFAIGELFRFGARRLADPQGLDLPALGGAVFMGFGTLMAAGGLVMAVNDPMGFVLTAFGLVFVAAGYLARRMFAQPAGMKAVTLTDRKTPIRLLNGNRGTGTRQTVLYVDANATDSEARAARQDWLRERWLRRPDWVAGSIVEDAVRRRGVVKAAIILWSLLAVAGIVAGRYWWNGASLLGVTALVVAAVLAGTAVLQAMRRRKFGASKLTLKSSPALLGGRLEGEVTTGVRRETPPREEFRLRLRCIHSWEETRYDAGTTNRRTYTHHDVLWEQEQRDPGRPSPARPGRLAVPVGFDLPPDKPPTDLDQADSDIRWELEISAAVPGLDYRSTFRLPVFHPDDAPDASPPPAGR